jgi:predicted nucleic acid-binding protein
VILIDTSGLFAALNVREPEHQAAQGALLEDEGPLVLSPFVLAELDFLVGKRAGRRAALDLVTDVGDGLYELAPMDTRDVAAARDVITRYSDLELGLADASVVVLADRYGTERVLTLDQRHFRVVRTPAGRPFTLLPADA